uniref:LAGLIDADG endonuclease n=1 Tax=Stachybotrys echinatus TaxID=80383 RepID=UPI001EDE9A87|nr:LAGLIDADG endonuclease [Stachybotrys echinatus]UIX25761.1 LAGLIDADG endonuclease [Stachybotrys echinatus]
MGLNHLKYNLEIDYMLGNILLVNYLLFIFYYLRKDIDEDRKDFLLNSKNNNSTISKDISILSAENFIGFSETTRQLFKKKKEQKNTLFSQPKTIRENTLKFYSWLAGIIDGVGKFHFQKNQFGHIILDIIEIKVNKRDLRILMRIQNNLHSGKIKIRKNHAYLMISDKVDMYYLINNLNGLIRIKINSFKKGCLVNNIGVKKPNYIIKSNDPYFSGLIDAIGSIYFNFSSNRIECSLNLQYNLYTSKLCLDYVIPHSLPYKIYRVNSIDLYKNIVFKFRTISSLSFVYDYFMKNRLYSDYKFYRISRMKDFLLLRNYRYSYYNSLEYVIYSRFLLKWIKYRNFSWSKVSWIGKLNNDIVLNLKCSVFFNIDSILIKILMKIFVYLFVYTFNKLFSKFYGHLIYNLCKFGNKYFLLFIIDIFKNKNKSLKLKIDYALDKLILYLFEDIKKINPSIFFLLSLILYSSFLDCNYLIYLINILLLNFCTLIFLIFITRYYIFNNLDYSYQGYNKNFGYFFIKYMLFGLILLNICLFFIVLNKLMNKLIDIIINYILNHILNISNINIKDYLNLKKKLGGGNDNNNKPPKGFKDLFNFFENKKKKTHKDISKKASEMKDKVINVQNEKLLNTNNLNNITTEKKEFYGNRKWEETISIQERPQLSIPQQLEKIKYEYKAYDNQEKKFQKTINNINNNKENFYPKESTSLFKDYIEVIKGLKINLKSMETNLKKRKK